MNALTDSAKYQLGQRLAAIAESRHPISDPDLKLLLEEYPLVIGFLMGRGDRLASQVLVQEHANFSTYHQNRQQRG